MCDGAIFCYTNVLEDPALVLRKIGAFTRLIFILLSISLLLTVGANSICANKIW